MNIFFNLRTTLRKHNYIIIIINDGPELKKNCVFLELIISKKVSSEEKKENHEMKCKISIIVFLLQLHDIDPEVTPSEMVDILFLHDSNNRIMETSWNNSSSKIFSRATTAKVSDENNTRRLYTGCCGVMVCEGESSIEKSC